MPAAARIGDTHGCAYHAGGPITTGCPTVFIREKPAARVADVATCAGPDLDAIEGGAETVFIGGARAARVFDPTNGGLVTSGEASVLIGPAASPKEIQKALRKLRRARRAAR